MLEEPLDEDILAAFQCPLQEQDKPPYCDVQHCPFGHSLCENGEKSSSLHPIPRFWCLDKLLGRCKSRLERINGTLVCCKFGFHPNTENLGNHDVFTCQLAETLLTRQIGAAQCLLLPMRCVHCGKSWSLNEEKRQTKAQCNLEPVEEEEQVQSEPSQSLSEEEVILAVKILKNADDKPVTTGQFKSLKDETAENSSKQSLAVLLGAGAEEHLRSLNFQLDAHSNLQLKQLPKEIVDVVLKKLPQIRQLIICLTQIVPDEVEQLERLLCSAKVVKLTLVIRYCEERWHRPDELTCAVLHRLLAMLTSMTELQFVALHLDGYFFAVKAPDNRLELPFLSRLQKCYLYSADDATVVLNAVQQFVGRQLFLLNQCGSDAGARLLQLSPTTAALIRSLNFFGWKQMDESHLRRLCEHFPRLSNLTLQLDKVTLPEMSNCLQTLKKLAMLSLRVHNLALHLEAIRVHRLTPLKSLRFVDLHLIDTWRTHGDLQALHLEQMMPNAEQIFICGNCSRCAICGSFGPRDGGRENRPEDKARVDGCIEQLTAPIKPLFKHLQVIDVKYFGCSKHGRGK